MSKNKRNRKVKRIIELLLINPAIKTIIKLIPLIGFTVAFGFFGVELNLKNSINRVTAKGIFIIIGLCAILIIYNLITDFYIGYMEKHEKNYSSLAKEVLSSLKALYKEKLDMLVKSFSNYIKYGGDLQELQIEYDHDDRIDVLLNELFNCIKKVTTINDDNISVILLYKFKDCIWDMRDINYCEVFDGPEDLATNPKSFATYVLKSKAYNFHFLNDKFKEGIKHKNPGEKEYTPIYEENERDILSSQRNKRKYGSIVGLKFPVKIKNITYIQAGLFISTFGKKIDSSIMELYREAAEDHMEKIILPYFEMNFKTELISMYLKSSKEKQNES